MLHRRAMVGKSIILKGYESFAGAGVTLATVRQAAIRFATSTYLTITRPDQRIIAMATLAIEPVSGSVVMPIFSPLSCKLFSNLRISRCAVDHAIRTDKTTGCNHQLTPSFNATM